SCVGGTCCSLPGARARLTGRTPPSPAGSDLLLTGVLLRLGLLDGLADLVHVQTLDLRDQVVERLLRDRTRVAEHRDPLAERHERGDGLDLEHRAELLLGVRVDLREGDLRVLARDLLVDRPEGLAGTTPLGPDAHQHDLVLGDGLLEVRGGDVDDCHDLPSSWGEAPAAPVRFNVTPHYGSSPLRATAAVTLPAAATPPPRRGTIRAGRGTPRCRLRRPCDRRPRPRGRGHRAGARAGAAPIRH